MSFIVMTYLMSSSININKHSISDYQFEQDHIKYISFMNDAIRNATRVYYEKNDDLVNHYTFSSEYEIENEVIKYEYEYDESYDTNREDLENLVEEYEIGEDNEDTFWKNSSYIDYANEFYNMMTNQ